MMTVKITLTVCEVGVREVGGRAPALKKGPLGLRALEMGSEPRPFPLRHRHRVWEALGSGSPASTPRTKAGGGAHRVVSS